MGFECYAVVRKGAMDRKTWLECQVLALENKNYIIFHILNQQLVLYTSE